MGSFSPWEESGHLYAHPEFVISLDKHVWPSPVAQAVKNPPAMQEMGVPSLGWEDPLEKGIATHSSMLAWRIPCREEPGGYSPGGHTESDTTKQLTQHFLTNMYHQPRYSDEEMQTGPGWYNPGLFLATVLDLGSANTTETPNPACPEIGSRPEPGLKVTQPQERSLEDQPQIRSSSCKSFFPFRKEK